MFLQAFPSFLPRAGEFGVSFPLETPATQAIMFTAPVLMPVRGPTFEFAEAIYLRPNEVHLSISRIIYYSQKEFLSRIDLFSL